MLAFCKLLVMSLSVLPQLLLDHSETVFVFWHSVVKSL